MYKTKIYTGVLATVFIINSGLAATKQNDTNNIMGHYVVGIGGNYNYATVPLDQVVMTSTSKAKGTVHNNRDKEILSINLLAGYHYMVNSHWTMQAELAMYLERGGLDVQTKFKDNALNNITNFQIQTNIRRKINLMPSVAMSYKMNDKWSVFGKVGVNFTKFHLSKRTQFKIGAVAAVAGGAGVAAIAPIAASSTDDRKKQKAFKIGVTGAFGGNYNINNQLMLRGEISGTCYNKIITADKIGGTKYEISIRPYYVTANVSLIYKFA